MKRINQIGKFEINIIKVRVKKLVHILFRLIHGPSRTNNFIAYNMQHISEGSNLSGGSFGQMQTTKAWNGNEKDFNSGTHFVEIIKETINFPQNLV